MYEAPEEIQDYEQKWLEAERALALNWVEPLSVPLRYEPIDHVDKNIEPWNEPPSNTEFTSRSLGQSGFYIQSSPHTI